MRNENRVPIQDLLDSIESAWPLSRWAEFNVVVAVSGGRDSVALLKALHSLKKDSRKLLPTHHANSGRIIVAHFNHATRGAESNADQAFVQCLSKQLDLECDVNVAEESPSTKLSENHFREQRYSFLRQVARNNSSRYIVTAHHAWDQVETILFRILRGTGIGGLAGMSLARPINDSLSIVRPMLSVEPDLIDAAMQSWNQSFRVDDSNADSNYSRNFLRNDVLPMLRERFGEQVDANVRRLGFQAAEHHDFLLGSVAELIKEAASISGGAIFVQCDRVQAVPTVVLREFFAELFRQADWPMGGLSFRDFDRLAQSVTCGSDVPQFQLPRSIGCSIENGQLKMLR